MTLRSPARLFAALALVLLSACSTLVPSPAAPPATATEAHAAWARVLGRFVDAQGEVDFVSLAAERNDLDRFLRFVADTPLESVRGEEEKLAHMINAYNALSMFNVVASAIPRSHDGWNKVRFFVLRRFDIGGRWMSLRGFENDVIRPLARARGDPRVHFALNCSALSCPTLPRLPFTATALDAELERESRAFFARPQNFRVEPAERVVWLNEILKFYSEDFVPVPARTLIEYANRYAPTPAPTDYAVRFTPYDWTIANNRRKR